MLLEVLSGFANVLLAHLAGTRSHLVQRGVGREARNGWAQVLVQRIAVLLINLAILISSSPVSSRRLNASVGDVSMLHRTWLHI